MDTSISPRRPLRALILDDLHDAADSLGTLARFWGHNPLVAYDGPTALDLARHNLPDVALLETGLRGGLDGDEVARRLRQLPGLDQLLLVAVTGYGREEDIRQCLDAGIDFHFVKPVDPGALQQLLDRAKAALDRTTRLIQEARAVGDEAVRLVSRGKDRQRDGGQE
jgi:CheY-like chemotaxis protein